MTLDRKSTSEADARTAASYLDQPPPTSSGEEARAFIRGTGRLFSVLGLVLMLVSGAVGLIGGRLLDPPETPAPSVREHFSQERLPYTLKAASLLAAFIGGLAMQAVGLALSADLGRGAIAAVVVSEAVSLTWLYCGLRLGLEISGQTLAGIVLVIFGLAMTLPSVFALRCVLLSRDLPPLDRSRLGREAWEEYERRRRR